MNPWMLLWLPAAAVPVLIHLWNRRKYREVSWAAMEYLLAAIVKSSRRMRIEQLLLLLVRTLVVLLVVFAVAEPFRNANDSTVSRGARTHRVILIDGSYSMDYRSSDRSAFDVAKERAVEIVRRGLEGDGYSLVSMTDRPQILVGTAAFSQEEFINEIEQLTLAHGGANLDAGLTAVEEVIQQARRDQKQLKRHHIYILSDLCRNTWAPHGNDDVATEQRSQRIKRLGQGGMVEVIASGGRRADNLAVTYLQASESFATITRPVTVTARLRNFSQQPQSQQSVELWVDGHRSDQQFVDLAAGDEVSVAYQHRFHSPGDHAVEIRISGDPLAIDNRRYLALPVKEHLNALLVSGKRNSTVPIEAALDGGDFQRGLTGTIRPEVVSESRLLELDLTRYDCIFLCNIGQLDSNEARALHDYLQQGGGLVTILGDQVIADRYNRELFYAGESGDQDAVAVLPARIGTAFYDGEYHFIDPLNYQHPMLAPWKGNPKSGLGTVPVVKYLRLELPEATTADVVMALSTGDPLVVESQIGAGRSVLVATDLSTTSVVDTETRRPWSLIASWLNSQPFFEGLWKTTIGGEVSQRNIQVGESFGMRHDHSDGHATMRVELPGDPSQRLPAASTPDAAQWSFSDTEISGFYRAGVGGDGEDLANGKGQASEASAGEMLFAVNVNALESDLEKLRPEDLPDGFNVQGDWVQGDWQDVESSELEAMAPSSNKNPQRLLCAVLVLLFSETFLAWWIGHRSA